jgi:membrane-associated protein
VAGIGQMRYRRFLSFSVIGALAWVGSFVLSGYFFGNIPAVKDNLLLLIVGIIILSLLPALRELIRYRKSTA